MSIWFELFTLEDLARQKRSPFAERLDMRFSGAGEDWLEATMPVDDRTRQIMGVLNGGASVAFAQEVGTVAANLCVDGRGLSCEAQEVNANHIRAVADGHVIATARPFHIGRSSHVWGVDIVTPDGYRVCVARVTIAVSTAS